MLNLKKIDELLLGPYATFYFESYETMLAQVQEMLYIEKGGDEQLKDELAAYNPSRFQMVRVNSYFNV